MQNSFSVLQTIFDFSSLLRVVILWLLSSLCVSATIESEKQITHKTMHSILYFEDDSGKLSFDVIRRMSDSEYVKVEGDSHLSFGYTNNAYWLKIVLRNTTQQDQLRYLNIGYAILDDITFYQLNNDQQWQAFKSGDSQPYVQRPFKNPTVTLPVSLAPEGQTTIYARVQSSSSLQIPINIWSVEELNIANVAHYTGAGIYFGCLLAMFFYHIFLALNLKEQRHLFYAAYVFSILTLVSCLEGLSYHFIWPEAVWWNQVSVIFTMGCTFFFGGLFAYHFLSLKHYVWRSRITLVFIGCSSIVILSSFVFPYQLAIKFALTDSIAGFLLAIWLGISRSIEGDIPARYFTLAFFSLISGGILYVANKIGILPANFVTENALMIGSAIQVILLSLAMADRLNREKQKRMMAQSELLRQERQLILSQQLALHNERKAFEAQKQTLVIQQRTNEILEQKVAKRTSALEKANKQLKEIATTDSLTGVKNRKYLDEIFHTECKRAQRQQTLLSVIMLDIDNFKAVNDEYGHIIGDRCLISVARQLKKSSNRASDVIGRFGGEEFIILLPNTPEDSVISLAETIRKNIENMIVTINDFRIKLTVSLGVATITPSTVAEGFHLIDHADKALYTSKRTGKNRVSRWQMDT